LGGTNDWYILYIYIIIIYYTDVHIYTHLYVCMHVCM
jgi:hypothetical protein